MNEKIQTIGIFDSGIGGLTVLKEVTRACPQANIIYLGDTARLPYGTKSPATIAKYLQQNVDFLMKKNVDAIIVACNSASTILKENQFPIPVVGVIEAGAIKATSLTKNRKVGVMGTKATIKSQSYTRAITKQNSDIEVFETPCPLLVPLVEEAMLDDQVTTLVLQRYLKPLLENNVDTIILACTHYPILKTHIQKIVGPEVMLVDSAECMANKFSGNHFTGHAKIEFYFTDISESFINLAKIILETHELAIEGIDL